MTGGPIMRPLVYHYEKDENAKSCNDEFLLGESVDYKDGNYLQYQFVADQAGNVTWNVVNNVYKNPYEQIIVRVLGEELC